MNQGLVRRVCTRPVFAALMAMAAAAEAAPVVTDVSFLTERTAPNSVPGFATATVANRTQWNVTLISSDVPGLVTVVASHPSFSPFNLFFNNSPIFANYLFSRNSVLFSEAGLLAFAGNPVPWSYTATDSSGAIVGLFPLIADPELLPFASNVVASDGSSTPTITWALPDLGSFDVDRVRLRVIDAASGLQIFQIALAASATDFTLPGGVLELGHSYFYRVMIEDLENGHLENRSNAFSTVAMAVTSVPEPGVLALLACALFVLGVTARRRGPV
jgi:hypothetical protein